MKNSVSKKIISAVSAATIASLCCGAAFGADDITVTLNGEALEFDVPPQIIEDRTLVPLRKIFESMGAEVDWDADLLKVTANDGETVVEMIIGEKDMTVNGETKELDVPPQIIDGRTLVPARAIAESFGAQVDWDGDTKTVIITREAKAMTEPEATAEPKATAEPEATAEPTATPAAEEFPITYDRSSEAGSQTMSNFELTSVKKTADGNYEIEYTMSTFKEGSGTVDIKFNCLDANGKTVDTFGGMFRGTDYTWSPQTGTATISGKTVTIAFAK